MPRILIIGSNMPMQTLLGRMVARLGYEPAIVRVPTPEQLAGAAAMIVEPAAPIGMALAQAASIAAPRLPLICASVTAPPAELRELGVHFAASLTHPFSLTQLGEVLERVL